MKIFDLNSIAAGALLAILVISMSHGVDALSRRMAWRNRFVMGSGARTQPVGSFFLRGFAMVTSVVGHGLVVGIVALLATSWIDFRPFGSAVVVVVAVFMWLAITVFSAGRLFRDVARKDGKLWVEYFKGLAPEIAGCPDAAVMQRAYQIGRSENLNGIAYLGPATVIAVGMAGSLAYPPLTDAQVSHNASLVLGAAATAFITALIGRYSYLDALALRVITRYLDPHLGYRPNPSDPRGEERRFEIRETIAPRVHRAYRRRLHRRRLNGNRGDGFDIIVGCGASMRIAEYTSSLAAVAEHRPEAVDRSLRLLVEVLIHTSAVGYRELGKACDLFDDDGKPLPEVRQLTQVKFRQRAAEVQELLQNIWSVARNIIAFLAAIGVLLLWLSGGA